MKIILLFTLFFSFDARADKKIPMAEIASAFTWIKIAPEFPVIITAESDDQIAFRFFDTVYTITRQKHDFKVTNKTETEIFDSLTIEKILKFVKAKKRGDAVLNHDAFLLSIKDQKTPEGYKNSKSIYQCSSDLPARISQNGGPINKILQHTWVQNGSQESFGMPNTDESTYFGGRAHIRTPDSFIVRIPKHLECSPVWIPESEDEQATSKRIACVSRAISLGQNPIFDGELMQDWVPHFDYHALERNCLVATRFALECAGAKASQVVNSGIGGKLNWEDIYSVGYLPSELKSAILELRAQLNLIRNEETIVELAKRTEALMNEALGLDSRLRGVEGFTRPANLREICNLALTQCSVAHE